MLGLYNQNPTLLISDNFVLPDGVDRSVLLPMILSESAELEVLYPEPQTFMAVLKAWSLARLPSWQRMLETLSEEYDPLHNYDRTETETGTTTGSGSSSVNEAITGATAEDVTDTVTEDLTDSTAEGITDETNGSTSTTTTGQVTGFNSSTFADNNKATTAGSSSDTTTRDRTATLDRDRTEQSVRDRDVHESRSRATDTSDSRSDSHNRTLRAYGNIGVTMSQQMVLEEIKVRSLDIYRIITNEFIDYFCLRVY